MVTWADSARGASIRPICSACSFRVDGPAVQVPALVQAVQLQKLLADVDEAVGGVADVGHKFPRRLPVNGRIL